MDRKRDKNTSYLVKYEKFDTYTAGGAGDKYEVWMGADLHFTLKFAFIG